MNKKKILFLFQYFRHPGEPGGTRIYWIAKALVEAGYLVTVITQRNSYNPENKNAPLLERINLEGINIVYIKNPYSNTFSYLKRVYIYLRFVVKSTWYSLKEKNVSLVIATSTPLSIGIPALALKVFRKKPFIFEIRDLWPEVPIQMGVIKNPLLIKALRWFERLLYTKSEHVVAASPGMAKAVEKCVIVSKVTIIPNMAKIERFWPREKNLKFADQHGLSTNSLKIIHFGTMGDVNGLENFVAAASLSQKNGLLGIDFILSGSGKKKEEYRKKIETENLQNLYIYDRMPMDEISELVNLSDICYIGVSKYKILENNSANKFFDSLSAGKPILINFGGWMQKIIEDGDCGIRVDATDPNDLLDKILFLRQNPEIRLNMGENARKIAETEFDISILCPKYVSLVDDIISKIE